jgi:quinol monooxygenase YgiN
MDSRCVHFVPDLVIHEGKLEEFERIVKSMNEGTARESGALGYEWFLSKDGKRCRLLETYANAAAVQEHLSGHVVQQLVLQLRGCSTVNRFEVYGVPDAPAAAALETFGAEIFRHWKAFPCPSRRPYRYAGLFRAALRSSPHRQ